MNLSNIIFESCSSFTSAEKRGRNYKEKKNCADFDIFSLVTSATRYSLFQKVLVYIIPRFLFEIINFVAMEFDRSFDKFNMLSPY